MAWQRRHPPAPHAARLELAAHRNGRDLRESPNDEEQIEARHVGHLEVGEKQVGQGSPHERQGGEAVLGETNVIAMRRECVLE